MSNGLSVWHLARREVRKRSITYGVSAAVHAVACAALLGALGGLRQHDRQTARVLRQKERQLAQQLAEYDHQLAKAMDQLGFNLTILPAEQNVSDWLADDYASETMPETTLDRLRVADLVTVEDLSAHLLGRVAWAERGWTVLVQGDSDLHLPSGRVIVGREIHQALGLAEGQTLVVNGRSLQVAELAKETGGKLDMTFRMSLASAQDLLGKPGRINEIRARQCRCAWNQIGMVAGELEKALPGLTVVENASETSTIAHARGMMAEQSQAMLRTERLRREEDRDRRARISLMLVLLSIAASGLCTALLTLENCRSRRVELALLQAIGVSRLRLQGLLLARIGMEAALGTTLGSLAVFAFTHGADSRFALWVPLALGASMAVALPAAVISGSIVSRTDPALVLKNDS